MRHRKKKKILDRSSSQRKILLRNLANELIIHRQIKTTLAKAKVLKPFIERLVTKARNNDIASRRYLQKYINQKALKILVSDIAPKYKERKGGYTRIVKIDNREGDNAKMSIIEFV